MFELVSFVRSFAFAAIYAGIEYRYVNRAEADWTKSTAGFYEEPAFWRMSPYQVLLLFPLFIVSGYTLPVTAWAGNVFLIATVEDIAYFLWRGKFVLAGEWTTTLMGSLRVGRYVIPFWWPLTALVAFGLYFLPL